MKEILKLTKKEIENLSFNQQMEYLEEINDLFQNDNGDMDVENALELYKKSLEILSKAKGKLNLLKEEKEKIDKEYEKLFDNEKIEEWNFFHFCYNWFNFQSKINYSYFLSCEKNIICMFSFDILAYFR